MISRCIRLDPLGRDTWYATRYTLHTFSVRSSVADPPVLSTYYTFYHSTRLARDRAADRDRDKVHSTFDARLSFVIVRCPFTESSPLAYCQPIKNFAFLYKEGKKNRHEENGGTMTGSQNSFLLVTRNKSLLPTILRSQILNFSC
jgi:hypothetical protein